MRKRKLISIILAVIVCMTAFVVPLYTNAAVSKSSEDISVNWETGRYNANNGATEGESYGYCIRANTYIDISSYTQISVNVSGNYQYNVHFYNDDYSFNSSSNGQFAYATTSGTIDTKGTYMTISIYKNPVTTSEGKNITIKGLKILDKSVIDGVKTASLTVHKYEMEDISKVEENEDGKYTGTGYSTDGENIPDDAKPLASVTFKVTKIRDWNSINTPNGITSISLPTPDEAKEYITEATENNETLFSLSKTTNIDGIASFTDLPLGLYLVQETHSPSQVVGAIKDFVIALPITNTEGDAWKYDVDVYPKNETRYQELTLEKTDCKTGKGIEGATFAVQIPTFNSQWTNFKTSLSNLTTDESGIITLPEKLPVKQVYRFQEVKAADDYILDSSNNTSYAFYLDENGNVCDTTTEHNIIDLDNPHRIQMTNTKPSIEKFIDKSKGNNTELVKSSSITRTGGDGEYDWYSIKVTTPNIDMSKIRTFTVTDVITASGGPGAPVVKNILKEDGTELSTSAYTSTKSPSYSNTGPYNLTVAFTPSSLEANTDYYIVVRTNVGKKNTTNTAKLTYSTNTTGTETTNEIESDEVNFYYFGYKLKKINGTTKAPLQNVEFKLYETLDNAEKQKNALQTVTTNSNGYAEFSYIDVGDRIENDEPVDIKEELEWETGGVNNTTGALENSDTYIRTKPVNVSLFSKIIYTGTTNIHQFYFYDKYDDFIGVENADKIKTEAIITVPNNAEQMIMTYGGTGISVNSPSSWLTSLDANSIIEGSYYVVETKTNSGFSLLKEPFEIAVNNKSASVVDKYMTTVNNYNKVEFPMTGGFGFILLFTIGVMCLIFAGIVNYKKKEWGMNYEN